MKDPSFIMFDTKSGVIETPDGIIFIEPIINEAAVKTKEKGKPHLIYRQSSLKQIKDVAFDMQGDYWTPLYAGGKPARNKFIFRAAKSYIRIINQSDRPVKVFYLDGDEEKLFSSFPIDDEQSINTFTSHRWIARDSISNKRLFIDGVKLFAPKANSEYDRKTITITIPKRLKLPDYLRPSPPDSHLKIINRSGRFVQIFYQDSSDKKTLFTTQQPNGVLTVSTYTVHRWFANDYDTGKRLWLNTRYMFIPIRSDKYNRVTVLVTVPINLKLPQVIYPEMLIQDPKYIEVMPAADSSVVMHHGKDKIERYILTLMNIKEIEITRSPMESLNTVCSWGHKIRKGWDKTTHDFHDQTIFITRKDGLNADEHRINNFANIAGYAPVASMCYRTRSCTLNEDDGFLSSFIIAHETGHTLGMEHDGTHNNCSKDIVKGSIMAPLVRSRFDRFHWSICSRRELIDHLDYLWCLDDIPFNSNRTLMNQLPGQVYNLDDQCVMDFGEGYSSCTVYTPMPKKCSKLWCDDNSYSWCRTRNTPPLEGTTCGSRKWCRNGHCVPMTKDGSFVLPTPKPTPKPVHGGWSSWSNFGLCSMNCGQGIKIRARACNQPRPRHNGLPCKGMTMGIAFCTIKACTGMPPTFQQIRSAQCLNRGSNKQWSFHDVYNANLDCDFENGLCGWEQDSSDNFDWTAQQGKTPSSKTGPSFDHTKGIGEKGTYLFIETSRPTDVGWKARLISKLVAKHVTCLSFWYHSFGDDDHFGHIEVLINTTKKEKIIWGHSGNEGDVWLQKYATILSVMPYKIVFQAIRGDGYRADMSIDDIVFTEGPCKLGISPPLEENKCLLSRQNHAHVESECRVPNSVKNPRDKLQITTLGKQMYPGKTDQFLHKYEAAVERPYGYLFVDLKPNTPEECRLRTNVLPNDPPQTGGQLDAMKTIEIPLDLCQTYCMSTHSKTIIKIPVKDGVRCRENPRILDVCVRGRCQVVGCDGIIGSKVMFDNCGICDGNNDTCTIKRGTVTLKPEQDEAIILECPVGSSNIVIQELSGNRRYLVIESAGEVRETFINGGSNISDPGVYHIGGTDFIYSRNNNSEKILALGPIKEGIIFKVTKVAKEDKTIALVKFQFYKPNKEPVVHVWKSIGWLNCTKPCGGGIEHRILECRRKKDSRQVKQKYCFGITQPKPKSRSCNDEPCKINFKWKTVKWSPCSVTCSEGMRKRRVYCERSTYGERTRPVLGMHCKDKKPPTAEKCRKKECEAMWVPGPWGKCSKTCGRGLRTRAVKCRGKDGKSSWKCTEDSKLPTRGHCVMIRCVADAPIMLGNLSCTFEAGFCLWRNTRREDDFDWQLRSGSTPSRYTGPHADHTFGSRKGKIIFETIRGNGFAGDSAIDDITVYQGKCPTTKFVKSECYGDTSRYCVLAVRFKWCSSRYWGEHLCCDSCAKEVKYRQRRKTPRKTHR
ncbi:hypothetical protein QZH41_019560 [Actinostola sp. cb2023]|nr:hypothetical protein QZH41_019560 [Actinostola sp. cb2023]